MPVTLAYVGGLTQHEFAAAVTAKSFSDVLVKSSLHTYDYDLPSGFLVATDGRQLHFSDIVYPNGAEPNAYELQDQALARFLQSSPSTCGNDVPVAAVPEFSLGNVTNAHGTPQSTALAVITHPRPLTPLGRRSPDLSNWPTVRDLRDYGAHLASNPELIAATSAMHQDLGGIALQVWRAEDHELAQRLHALHDSTPINGATLGLLGLRTIVLTFDRGNGRVLSGMNKISELYSGS